jgi:hypothetical protein
MNIHPAPFAVIHINAPFGVKRSSAAHSLPVDRHRGV